MRYLFIVWPGVFFPWRDAAFWIAGRVLRPAPQPLAGVQIIDPRRIQCSFQLFAVELRIVPAVWNAAYIDQQRYLAASQQFDQAFCRLVAVPNGIDFDYVLTYRATNGSVTRQVLREAVSKAPLYAEMV